MAKTPYYTYSHDVLNYMVPWADHLTLQDAFAECMRDPTIRRISARPEDKWSWSKLLKDEDKKFDAKLKGVNPAYDESLGDHYNPIDWFWYCEDNDDFGEDGYPTKILSNAEFTEYVKKNKR